MVAEKLAGGQGKNFPGKMNKPPLSKLSEVAWFPVEPHPPLLSLTPSLTHSRNFVNVVVCRRCCHLSFLSLILLSPFIFCRPALPQINKITGHVRPIKRMVTDRQGCPLPRCPKENMPITCFREGTNYSLVTVTKARRTKRQKVLEG